MWLITTQVGGGLGGAIYLRFKNLDLPSINIFFNRTSCDRSQDRGERSNRSRRERKETNVQLTGKDAAQD